MRKKYVFVLFPTILGVVFALTSFAALPDGNDDCATIKHGEVFYSAGHYLAGLPIPRGFDPYGYNYQAHLFDGSYANAYLGGYGYPPYDGDDESYLAENPTAQYVWCWPYRDTRVMMKWNDAWLSNKDCDGDGKLDRYYNFPSYIGSGAWLTNHMWGSYVDEETGKTCHWNYFVKIVAVPADANLVNGIWYAADGTEIGPVIWGEFAIIMEVENDGCAGLHGQQYLSPYSAGFGKYGPKVP